MTTTFATTEDWQLWEVVLRSPEGYAVTRRVRAPSQGEAMDKVVASVAPSWRIAVDASENPIIWRVRVP